MYWKLLTLILSLLLSSSSVFAIAIDPHCSPENLVDNLIFDTQQITQTQNVSCLQKYNNSSASKLQKYKNKICDNGKFELNIDIH